jgi:hypothetical protein
MEYPFQLFQPRNASCPLYERARQGIDLTVVLSAQDDIRV